MVTQLGIRSCSICDSIWFALFLFRAKLDGFYHHVQLYGRRHGGCSADACYHRCQPLGYECLLYENPVCNNNTRCLVGDTKIETMLYALNKGYVAIFVDLDVFIRKDPLIPFQPEDPYSIVCMFDMPPYLNFGLFVARPDDYTLGLFRWMKMEFHVKEENDQVLFNRYIQKEHVPVQVNIPSVPLSLCPSRWLHIRPLSPLSSPLPIYTPFLSTSPNHMWILSSPFSWSSEPHSPLSSLSNLIVHLLLLSLPDCLSVWWLLSSDWTICSMSTTWSSEPHSRSLT